MEINNLKGQKMNSFQFMSKTIMIIIWLGLTGSLLNMGCVSAQNNERPNIILIMSDDQGWGDAGYNGHNILQTPNLDAMAAEGVRFNRWYSGAPVCSPTRGSCLTGRHPFRYGVFFANEGRMRKQEITLAEVLKPEGYTTGHFGKWHLGTLTKTVKDANRGGPEGIEEYSPPWENGFDVCFSTESKVPTWDPMLVPAGRKRAGEEYGTYYWTGPEQMAKDNLSGDDSRVIMDRALPFIRRAVKNETPFLSIIWFHTPHLPIVAGPDYRAMYKDHPVGQQHYFGAITAMDDQIGRLRKELNDLGASDNTMIWFCSDNGPEGKKQSPNQCGSTGGLRGRKRSLYEGGVRVPGLLVWPNKIKKSKIIDSPCSTSDYFPTVLEALGISKKGQVLPSDGVSLLSLIEEKTMQRPAPIAFESRGQIALIDNRYKIYSPDNGESWQLYDLIDDPEERNDLANEKPEIMDKMKNEITRWRQSCKNSLHGNDYTECLEK